MGKDGQKELAAYADQLGECHMVDTEQTAQDQLVRFCQVHHKQEQTPAAAKTAVFDNSNVGTGF